MKKINWEERFKNPIFWFNIALSVFVPIFAYFGVKAQDMTTWNTFFTILLDAIKNPYVVFTVVVSVWNTVINPTTKGVTDDIPTHTDVL